MDADTSAEITPNASKFVCPSPKVLDFNEKRLHWSSVVRVSNQYKKLFLGQTFEIPTIVVLHVPQILLE